LPAFFWKVPELSRTILEKSDNVTGLFLELPDRDRKFSKKSAEGRMDRPGFGNGLRRWGLCPHTPMSEQCRRPRQGAPAVDQLPATPKKENHLV
jgi:hypothetical protein